MICKYCKRDKGDVKICPFCHNAAEHLLPAGTVLGNRYIIQSVSDENDMAIIYAAHDHNLDKPVTVAEYFPGRYCERKSIVKADDFLCISYFRLPKGANLSDYAPDGSYRQYNTAEVVWTDALFFSGMDLLLDAAKNPNAFDGPITDICKENNTVYLVTERLDSFPMMEFSDRVRAVCSGESFYSFVVGDDPDDSGQQKAEPPKSDDPKPEHKQPVGNGSSSNSFDDVISGKKKPSAAPPKAIPVSTATGTQKPAADTAAKPAAAANQTNSGEYGGFIKLLAFLIMMGTIIFDYLMLFPKRTHWLAFDTGTKIAIVIMVILINLFTVLIMKRVNKPYIVKKSTGLIVGTVLLALYLVFVVPSVWQWDEPETNTTLTGGPAKIEVTETDAEATSFEFAADYLFSTFDLQGYQYPSSYDGATYKRRTSDDGDTYYYSELENPDNQDCQLDSQVTIDSQIITIGKTTIQDLLDNGFTRSDTDVETNSETIQYVNMHTRYNDPVMFTISKTEDDPNKAVIQGITLLKLNNSQLNYNGISFSSSLKAVIDNLGPPSEYYLSSGYIQLIYKSTSSDVGYIIIDFDYNAASNYYTMEYLDLN